MWKRACAIAIVLLTLGASKAEAQNKPGPFGVGLILGEPSGLSGKLMLSDANALQLHLGYGVGRRGRLVLVLDYLFHIHNVMPATPVGLFSPYVGVGGRLGVRDEPFDDDVVLGVRIPVGLSFVLTAAPVELFAEVAVGIGLLPETAALIDGGLGGRFYF